MLDKHEVPGSNPGWPTNLRIKTPLNQTSGVFSHARVVGVMVGVVTGIKRIPISGTKNSTDRRGRGTFGNRCMLALGEPPTMDALMQSADEPIPNRGIDLVDAGTSAPVIAVRAGMPDQGFATLLPIPRFLPGPTDIDQRVRFVANGIVGLEVPEGSLFMQIANRQTLRAIIPLSLRNRHFDRCDPRALRCPLSAPYLRALQRRPRIRRRPRAAPDLSKW
jgi:hypothetical protein